MWEIVNQSGVKTAQMAFCIQCGAPSPAAAPFMDEVVDGKDQILKGYIHKQCEAKYREAHPSFDFRPTLRRHLTGSV